MLSMVGLHVRILKN